MGCCLMYRGLICLLLLEFSAGFLYSMLVDIVDDEAAQKETQGHHKGHKHSGRKSRMGGYSYFIFYLFCDHRPSTAAWPRS